MELKHLTLGLAAILAVGGVATLGLSLHTPVAEPTTPLPQEEAPQSKTFHSNELGLMFTYPANYTLETHEQGTAERIWTTLVLIDSDILREARENGASEGPPAIAVQIFDNVEQYTAEEWVKGVSYSNYKLSADGVLAPTTIGGEPALAYHYSGLFETEAVAVAHGTHIYLVSVDWLTPQDKNVEDFEVILGNITFH